VHSHVDADFTSRKGSSGRSHRLDKWTGRSETW
jgi:hypothetical protein